VAVVEAVRGSLLTRHFVAHVLGDQFAGRLGEASLAAGRRRCVRWRREAHARLGPASSVRAIWEVGALPLFAHVGFAGRFLGLARHDLLIARLEGAGDTLLTIVVGPWQQRLDAVWRVAVEAGVEARRRWCVCFNGHQLRVVDVDRPYARRFLEFDLRQALEDERGFPLFWALLRPEALETPARGPALIDQIVAACDAHGGSVREALQHGVRHALASLAIALARADRRRAARSHTGSGTSAPPAAVVEQALTMIYRLLFLLFAEARALVPVWHPVYRDSYSIGALHAAAAGRRQARGLWAAVQAVSRLAHEGCVADDLSVTAFNGQLFAPEHTPLGEHLHIRGPIVADILDALMMTPARASRGRERITYADLGVEQLGTVYERVLDYAPLLEREIDAQVHMPPPQPRARPLTPIPTPSPSPAPAPAPPVPPRRSPERSSVRRKESGSFYTPRSMADYLVRTTLGPLVIDAAPDDILQLRVLDPAMGSGAFLVSACRFLAAAHDRACERTGRGPVSSAANAQVRRHIARSCLFGVDLNPMAVQLARLSVWLTTMRRDAPLTFLDHHLRVGDSLVGASLDDLVNRRPARTPRRSRQTRAELPLFAGDEHAQLMQAVLPTRAVLAADDDSASTVREKERLLRSLTRESALARWLQLADAWCASWFGSTGPAAAWPAIADDLLHGHATFPRATLDAWLASVREAAERRRFFHWTLELPEVFFDQHGQPLANGGFDAILGNPPWDMIRNDAPIARDTGALSRFVREAGVYRSAGDAHFNCYQLFVERSLALLKRGGRLGLVLPWGLVADHGSARLRRRVLESCDLDTLVGFENNRAIFPIHRSTRFVLLTATTGRATTSVRCRFGERDPAALDTFTGAGGIAVTVDLLRRVSGEGLAFPDVRDPMDIALLERLHAAHPPLASADGWQVKFGRELNVSDDRALIEPIGRPGRPGGIPVIDGKHLRPFTISLDAVTMMVRPEQLSTVRARLPDVGRMRLGFRDVASPTNRLTLIAALLPADAVSTHTVSCVKTSLAIDAQWCLCALLNSFVANYLVRVRVSTHVTVALMERMPVPRPLLESSLHRELADLARRLSGSDSDPTRGPVYARLQACAAQAYGLTDAELQHVLGRFPLIEEETKQATLESFRQSHWSASA
jgi:N-6 DNA Methylase/Eco57I restriction-modification methylase